MQTWLPLKCTDDSLLTKKKAENRSLCATGEVSIRLSLASGDRWQSHYIIVSLIPFPLLLRVDLFLHEHPHTGEVRPLVEDGESSPKARCRSPRPPPGRTGPFPGLGRGGGTRRLWSCWSRGPASGAGTKQPQRRPWQPPRWERPGRTAADWALRRRDKQQCREGHHHGGKITEEELKKMWERLMGWLTALGFLCFWERKTRNTVRQDENNPKQTDFLGSR